MTPNIGKLTPTQVLYGEIMDPTQENHNLEVINLGGNLLVNANCLGDKIFVFVCWHFIATIQKIQSIGRSRCKVKTQDLLSPASELTRPSKMPMSITHLQSYIALRSISALVFFITINHNILSILFMILTSNGHDWDIVAKLVSKNPHYNPRRRENLYKNH